MGKQRWHATGAVSTALPVVVRAYREDVLAKKLSASSRREKQISASADSLFSRPPPKRQKEALAGIVKRQAAGRDSVIDYSDVPALTDEQLSRVHRTPKVLVAARLDRDVYNWFRHYGDGLFHPHHQQHLARCGVQSPIGPQSTWEKSRGTGAGQCTTPVG